MSTEFFKHALATLPIYYWIGFGVVLALMTTVYKWTWRALGYFWNQTFGPPSVRDYPVWRAPEQPVGAPPEDGRPARKPS